MIDPVDDNERLRRLMQRELEQARDDLTRIAAGADETEAELQDLARRLSVRETELETIRTDLTTVSADLSTATTALGAAEAHCDALRSDLAHREAEIATLRARIEHSAPGILRRGVRKVRRTLRGSGRPA